MVIFYLAFVPQFIHPAQGPAAVQMLVLGAIFWIIGATWDLAFASPPGPSAPGYSTGPASGPPGPAWKDSPTSDSPAGQPSPARNQITRMSRRLTDDCRTSADAGHGRLRRAPTRLPLTREIRACENDGQQGAIEVLWLGRVTAGASHPGRRQRAINLTGTDEPRSASSSSTRPARRTALR